MNWITEFLLWAGSLFPVLLWVIIPSECRHCGEMIFDQRSLSYCDNCLGFATDEEKEIAAKIAEMSKALWNELTRIISRTKRGLTHE